MSKSFILIPSPKGTIERPVKNLGWLLRHWQQVESIGFNYHPDNKAMVDGQLIAKLRDGSSYISDYASISVCWNWLNRPVFKTVKFSLVWNFPAADKRKEFVIGDDTWKRINRMEYHAQLAEMFSI